MLLDDSVASFSEAASSVVTFIRLWPVTLVDAEDRGSSRTVALVAISLVFEKSSRATGRTGTSG